MAHVQAKRASTKDLSHKRWLPGLTHRGLTGKASHSKYDDTTGVKHTRVTAGATLVMIWVS